MEGPGDVYAIALRDDELRAGLTALHQENRREWSELARGARSALAVALRALAAVVDAPRATATADRTPAVART
jgi:hypothetical protein